VNRALVDPVRLLLELRPPLALLLLGGAAWILIELAVAITVLVGLSRVYLDVHRPSDVVAGWTLGGGWAIACWLLATWFWPGVRLPEGSDPRPGAPG